jgi:metallo-beta-lactamase family protein
MKVKFLGATETVTGSKHLIISDLGTQVLLDFGLYQGAGKNTDELNRHLGLNPSEITAMILSHAHIDHSGNIPNLVKQGFNGPIYCTDATYDVCKILLMDSANIHESDVKYINKKRERKGKAPIKPLYTKKDAEQSLKNFKVVPYNEEIFISHEITFHFSDVGHIIGSAAINLTFNENDIITKLTYTGDVGRYGDMLLKDPKCFQQADYIICESTYGDKLHEDRINSELSLLNIVMETCVLNKGRLIIPSFSLGRTQEIVFILNKLFHANQLPPIKIFVDSPLSSKATDIVRNHPECYNERVLQYMKKDNDIFGFSTLTYIEDYKDSQMLNDYKEPCIIISASGMADAGRVKHHIKHAISNPNNCILIVGYCAPGTLGSNLVNGEKEVHIYGDFYKVLARVEQMSSYSAHADYLELIKFLSCQDKNVVKQILLVHGEDEAKSSFKEKLLNEGYQNVIIPHKGEIINLK